MLTCHACIRRCLQSVIRDFTAIIKSSRGLTTDANARRNSVSSNKELRSPRSLPNERQPTSSGTSSPKSRFKNANILADARKLALKQRGARSVYPISNPNALPSRPGKQVRKHLEYLQDPLKLAEFVRKTLRNDDWLTAVTVVRYASRSIQCAVSWNHLIEWQLWKGQMNAAIKTYNEVSILSFKFT